MILAALPYSMALKSSAENICVCRNPAATPEAEANGKSVPNTICEGLTTDVSATSGARVDALAVS